ncbi:hypothetical protein OUZ56_009295 [Daphnia magna]|uniref:Uncharacterized protein n=1 Tax=Daphnia magna TaxID=35525 RepID=A0ABR0AFK2_9CRUS|nr:hypothetical protein OUZ56_009295 [Daphnia magna]
MTDLFQRFSVLQVGAKSTLCRTVGSISPAVDAVRSKGRQDFSLHHFSKLTLMMIRPGRQNLLAIDRRGYKIQSDGDHHSLSDKKKKEIQFDTANL